MDSLRIATDSFSLNCEFLSLNENPDPIHFFFFFAVFHEQYPTFPTAVSEKVSAAPMCPQPYSSRVKTNVKDERSVVTTGQRRDWG